MEVNHTICHAECKDLDNYIVHEVGVIDEGGMFEFGRL